MNTNIIEIGERLYGMRQMLDISAEEMSSYLGISVQEYLESEKGNRDFSFTFLYKCAEKFGIDIIELITGDMPRLSFYTIVRKDKGLPIKRREGLKYQHLAFAFKHKLAEPFVVTAPYIAEEQDKPIALSYHKGQEFNYIIKGKLKVAFEDHIEILNEGDSAFYDSAHGHGMIATGGEECVFLAIVLKPNDLEEKR